MSYMEMKTTHHDPNNVDPFISLFHVDMQKLQCGGDFEPWFQHVFDDHLTYYYLITPLSFLKLSYLLP